MIPSTNAARRLRSVSTAADVTSEDQDDHDRWFRSLLDRLRRRDDKSRSEQWERVMDEAPRLDTLEPGQLSEMMRDAEPATDDDVPWKFPVRTPLEDHR